MDDEEVPAGSANDELLGYVVDTFVDQLQLDLMSWLLDHIGESGSIVCILDKLQPRQWVPYVKLKHVSELKGLIKTCVVSLRFGELELELDRERDHWRPANDLSQGQLHMVLRQSIRLCYNLTTLDNGDSYMQSHISTLGAEACALPLPAHCTHR